MINDFTIAQPEARILIFARSRRFYLWRAAAYLAGIVVMCIVLSSWTSSVMNLVALRQWPDAVMWPFLLPFLMPVLLLVLFLVQLARSLAIAIRGEAFIFDGRQQLVMKGERVLASFLDVDAVAFRRRTWLLSGRQGPQYSISIVLKRGRAIRLENGRNYAALQAAATAIAEAMMVDMRDLTVR